MIELLTILTPIALLDSASIVPLCIVVMVVLLAGPRPVLKTTSFILGVFTVCFATGLLVLLGLGTVLDELGAYTIRLWKSPETEELILQMLIGLVLCAVGLRMALRKTKPTEKPVAKGMTAVQAFGAGAALTVIGLPAALPYLAAIELVLREHLSLKWEVVALGYYNAIFVAPLAALVGLHLVLGQRSREALLATQRFLDTWGERAIMLLLIVLGAVLVADAIGWFFGHPLIPV